MKNYTVYFECYGKNMKTTVDASSAYAATEIVKDRIRIINIVTVPEVSPIFKDCDVPDIFKDIFKL